MLLLSLDLNFVNALNGHCGRFSTEINDCIRFMLSDVKTPSLLITSDRVN